MRTKNYKMKYLLKEVDDLGILTLTINQPKKLNALSKPLLGELDELITEGIGNDAVKGIILTGAGDKAFVAGADISEFQGISNENAVAMARNGQELFRKIECCPKPVIAAINGFALGGGCELAMACHMRIASEAAIFGQPEVNLGLIPGYGGTQRLVQLIGKGRAIEFLMNAQMIKADRAYEMGLVNHVVPAEELLEKCKAVLKKMVNKSPLTLAKIVECVDAVYDPKKDGYQIEAEAFGECFGTEDYVEGVTAFLEKRKPQFTGK